MPDDKEDRGEKGYQGWTNRATWNVSLWLNNDEGLYLAAREYTDHAENDVALAETLEDLVRRHVEEKAEGILGDLVGIVLSQVNWEEIAQGFLEGRKPEAKEPETPEEPLEEPEESFDPPTGYFLTEATKKTGIKRPPKGWATKMLKDIKKKNPSYSAEKVRETMGSIWYNKLSDSKRKEIKARYYGKGPKKESVDTAIEMLLNG